MALESSCSATAAGSFTAVSTPVTIPGRGNVVPVVGDWNNDGKLDLAFNQIGTPGTLVTFLGKGDGTFAQGPSYAAANNLEYVSAADLDGDGNLDLIVGESNGGFYGSDYNSGGIFQC